MKITIIEGKHAQQVRQMAYEYLKKIYIKKQLLKKRK